MKYYLQAPLKNLSFLFLFLFCTSSLVRAQNKYTLGTNDVRVNGQGVITGWKSGFTTNKDIIIPKTIGNKTITGIGFWAFRGKALTSVTFNENPRLTSIGGEAFFHNDLTSVTFPAGLTTIGYGAFDGNDLTSLDFPAGLTSIGERAFRDNDLRSLDFPASLTTIGSYAFNGNNIESVTFPDNSRLTSIGSEAFSDNSSLASIKLPTNSNGGFEGYKDSGGEEYDPDDDFEEFSRSLEATIVCDELTSEHLDVDPEGVITKYKDATKDATNDAANGCIIIPETIGNKTITGIGDRAFFHNDLTSVTFPASLTTIGEVAFYGNSLTSVTFPENSRLTSIGSNAFSDNPEELTGITLPTNSNGGFNNYVDSEGNMYDPDDDFEEFSRSLEATIVCDKLTSDHLEVNEGVIIKYTKDAANGCIIIPEKIDGQTITGIGGIAFYGKGLTSVTFPDNSSLTTIGIMAFRDNDLRSLDLPASLTTIGDYAFPGNVLTSVTFPDNSSLTTIGIMAFHRNALASLDLPASLTSIGDYAFYYNDLSSLDFPDKSSLTSIGSGAFYGNSNLASIKLPTNSNGGFEGYKDSGGNIYNPNDDDDSNDDFSAFGSRLWANIVCDKLTSEHLKVNEGVITEYTNDAANGCIIIPSTYTDDNGEERDITGIADRVFQSEGLISVTFPDSLKTIGEWAFTNNNIESVTFPASLTTIGNFAFTSNAIESVTFPASLTTIGERAFRNNRLTQVTFEVGEKGSSIVSIGEHAFSDNILTSIKLPKNSNKGFIGYVDDDNEYDFGEDFTNFSSRIYADLHHILTKKDVVVENGIITKCKNESLPYRIIIPETINGETITGIAGNSVFEGKYLTSVIFPASLKTIGERAFIFNDLTSVTFPASLTTIGEEAFTYNDIESVTFPASLTSIGDYAFHNNKLTQVTFEVGEKGSSIVSIGKDAFYENINLTSIILPTNSNEGFEEYFEEDDEGKVEKRNVGFEFYAFRSRIYAVPYILTKKDVEVDDENGIITKCINESLPNRIIIPETIDGKTITGIVGNSVFRDKGLTSVTFSKNSKVTTIGEWTFNDNALTTLNLPAGLTTIGDFAFKDNALTTLNLPAGLTTIGDYAFHNNALTEVTFPTSLTTIGEVAFHNNALTEVTFPASLTTIGSSAFLSNALTKVTFVEPSSIEVIGSHAFTTNDLRITGGITLPENINHTNITYDDGEEEYSHGDKFTNFERTLTANLTPYVFKSGDLEVENGVITKCKVDNLENKRIVIPEEWPNIQGELEDIIGIADKKPLEKGVFEDKGITSVTFSENSKLTSIGVGAFENNNLRLVTFPNSLISIGGGAFIDNDLTSLDFPDGLTTIGDWAFYRNKLETVSFPEPSNIQSIGAGAFSWNSSLTGIKLPAFADSKHNVYIARDENNEQKYLPGQDFLRDEFYWSLEASFSWEACHTLTSEELTVNEGVITACSYDFTNKCIVIPEQIDIDGKTITGIVDGSYYEGGVFDRQDLTLVKFPASLTTIGDYAFSGNYLPSLDLSALSNLTTIGDYAFSNNALTSVTFSAGLTSIGRYAFYDNDLPSLDLSALSNLTTIGDYAFSNNALTSVTFSASLTSIGRYAFHSNLLEELSFAADSKLESIGLFAFASNSLEKINLPPSLKTIYGMAFYRNKLEEVTFDLDEHGKSSIQSIGGYAFYGNNNLGSITLPDNNNENFQGYSDSYGNTYEFGNSFSDFYPSYSIVTSDPSSSRMAIYDASHSDVEILEQPQPFTYYPNPVVSQLTVTANVGDRILILNQVGVTVYDEVVTSVVAHQIDVTDFPRGVYLIRLISAEGSVITKRLAKH